LLIIFSLRLVAYGDNLFVSFLLVNGVVTGYDKKIMETGMTKIESASKLIDSIGGLRACAEAWDVTWVALRQAAYRGSLPVKLWPKVLERCREQGVNCTAEDLMWLWIKGR
jgi:hypothetical protein